MASKGSEARSSRVAVDDLDAPSPHSIEAERSVLGAILIDKDNNERAVPTRYVGIEMNMRGVAKFLKEVGYKGVLANAWRNPELAEKAIKSI
mgnify:CR=1 FL=1